MKLPLHFCKENRGCQKKSDLTLYTPTKRYIRVFESDLFVLRLMNKEWFRMRYFFMNATILFII